MATLDDLATADLGPIGWWNALEHGADFLDAGEVIQYNGVEDYTAYDNGIEGGLSRHPALKYRAKTDGWIVVYFDTAAATVNPEDFLTQWGSGLAGDLTQTALSEEVDGLRSACRNAGEMVFDHSDVGLYDYRYPDLSQYRLMTINTRRTSAGTVCGYAYSDGNRPIKAPYTARGWVYNDYYGPYSMGLAFDGTEIISPSTYGETHNARPVEDGVFDASGEFYSFEFMHNEDSGSQTRIAMLALE